ncbi:hypothetical protein FQA39_LY02418 [Lamprigera yunnana]|nr:hypothetical protein FQA39_LY02418 [Lamprigera yunnana]
MSNMDLLIAEVKNQPPLWDQENQFYKNRMASDECWATVAKNCRVSSRFARDKWKNLRDQFKRELNKVKKGTSGPSYRGKWRYFESLSFLKKMMVPKQHQCANEKPQEDTQHDDVAAENEGTNSIFDDSYMIDEFSVKHERDDYPSTSFSEPPDDLSCAEIKNSPLANSEAEEDPDLYFLKSLVPYFHLLPVISKLQVRNQFQNILINELTSLPSDDGYETQTTVTRGDYEQNSSLR